jgi:hypothetical protein
MAVQPDQDFSTALLGALLREADALTARGIALLSSQVKAIATPHQRFVLVHCRPLAAHLFLVHPDGSPHEYYRETGDELPTSIADLVAQFITTGMNELSVSERQDVSRRLETEGIGLAVLIESDKATARGLAVPRSGGLVDSEELFRLVGPS